MQLGKILGAGTLAALMMGSSIAFAATLADYPQPFVTSSGAADFLVVVGAAAAPSDVVGAIDASTRLGSESYTSVATGGTTSGVSVSGEGKAVATANTKVYIDDTLGKSGLRNTMTKDELTTLLADGTVVDTNGTSYKYQQFIYLTPSDTTTGSSAFRVLFDKPGAGGTEDPEYTIGKDITTSPTSTSYLYRTSVSFDRSLPRSTAIGQKIKLFGKEYTVHSDTTFESTSKLVLAGGSDKRVLTGGEKVTATVSGASYEVTFVGSSSSTVGVVKVGTEQKSITRGTTQKIGGLDVYLDDVFQLSTTDQTQNSASLLLGAEKLILQDGSKVKKGDNEDSVDGTSVAITESNNQISAFTVYTSAKSSTSDFVKKGGSLSDPVWQSFSLAFPSVTPDAKQGDKLTVQNSGDNLLQLTFKDYRGNEKSITWAYKATSAGSTFSLADSGGDAIHVVENESVSQNQYIVVDGGDFAHIYEVSSVNVDGTSSSSIGLADAMSGTTLTVTLGTDNSDQKVIDGQSYYFQGIDGTADAFTLTWGTNAALNDTGKYVTAFPVIKTSKGGRLALTTPNVNVPIRPGGNISLPTGAVQFTTYTSAGFTYANLSAVSREDGTGSALGSAVTALNLSNSGGQTNVTVGRTSTGGTVYTLTAGPTTASVNVTLVGSSSDAILTQPAVLLVEEKDNAGDEYSVTVPVTTETSGSNNVAVAGAPRFTATEDSSTLGSNSDLTDYVDLWGTYVQKNSNGQDKVTVWYPDDQVTADVFVLASGATTSTSAGISSTTVKQATAVKTAVARLDSEVGSTEKSTKNLVLVGGPAVNTLVAELAAADKTWKVDKYRTEGAGTAVIQLVADAFTSGKSALVVAGHSADDTRAATSVLLKFDENADKLKGTLAKLKNGVWTTESA